MKRIAMLNCLKANRVCAGAACLKAFYEHTRAFERYGDETLVLTAYMRCNGCGRMPDADPGMQEKLERLVSEQTDVLHIGRCTILPDTGTECPVITRAAAMAEASGITVVRGTH